MPETIERLPTPHHVYRFERTSPFTRRDLVDILLVLDDMRSTDYGFADHIHAICVGWADRIESIIEFHETDEWQAGKPLLRFRDGGVG